jgi:hypothetical protein
MNRPFFHQGARGVLVFWAAFSLQGLPAAQTVDATDGKGRVWTLTPGCRLEKNLLTVEIVPARWGATEWARTRIDLSPYEGEGFEARIRVRGERIAPATQPWLGFKFMMRWEDRFTGAMHYPGAGAPGPTFDWCVVSFRQVGAFRGAAGGGCLHLGLQGTSGRLVFDLDSLKVSAPSPLWPVTNRHVRCAYTPEVMRRPRACGVMSPSGRDMTEDDFKTLKSWGATLLRYQMVRDWHGVGTNGDLAEFDRWLDGRLDHAANTVLPLSAKYGIKTVLDLHVTPGGRDAAREMNMFHDGRFARHFVAVWRRIATRFRAHPAVWAYDLVNEPQQQRAAAAGMDGWSLQKAAAEAIRRIDPVTPIVIESNAHASPAAFRNLSPLALTNIFYEVHLYDPGEFTHQGISGFPMARCRWPDAARGWDAAYLRSVLAPVRDFQQRHGARIYVGEFSAVAWADGADRYLSDALALFAAFGWDWSYHAFREWKGWSVEHEGASIEEMVFSADNPRKQALLEGFRRGKGAR